MRYQRCMDRTVTRYLIDDETTTRICRGNSFSSGAQSVHGEDSEKSPKTNISPESTSSGIRRFLLQLLHLASFVLFSSYLPFEFICSSLTNRISLSISQKNESSILFTDQVNNVRQFHLHTCHSRSRCIYTDDQGSIRPTCSFYSSRLFPSLCSLFSW